MSSNISKQNHKLVEKYLVQKHGINHWKDHERLKDKKPKKRNVERKERGHQWKSITKKLKDRENFHIYYFFLALHQSYDKPTFYFFPRKMRNQCWLRSMSKDLMRINQKHCNSNNIYYFLWRRYLRFEIFIIIIMEFIKKNHLKKYLMN